LGNEERDEENEAFQTPQIRGNPVEEWGCWWMTDERIGRGLGLVATDWRGEKLGVLGLRSFRVIFYLKICEGEVVEKLFGFLRNIWCILVGCWLLPSVTYRSIGPPFLEDTWAVPLSLLMVQLFVKFEVNKTNLVMALHLALNFFILTYFGIPEFPYTIGLI
jgi:hypothetical protein